MRRSNNYVVVRRTARDVDVKSVDGQRTGRAAALIERKRSGSVRQRYDLVVRSGYGDRKVCTVRVRNAETGDGGRAAATRVCHVTTVALRTRRDIAGPDRPTARDKREIADAR